MSENRFVPGWLLLAGVLISVSSAESLAKDDVSKTAVKPDTMIRITVIKEGLRESIEGRVLIQAQDGGVILEERSGRLRQLTGPTIESRESLDSEFTSLTTDELAATLLSQVPSGFEITQTDHYVVCSNSSEAYADFCGKLLERVVEQYFTFMKAQDISVHEPEGKLAVIIFESEREFTAFATKQHPESSFEETPGYYSIMANQMLLLDLTRDRSVRSAAEIRRRLTEKPLHVATMVHEAVHQLAFNTGLQVRMADNPLWFSEGLALYFEPLTPRSSLLWTKPGIVNTRHYPVLAARTQGSKPPVSLRLLMETDRNFLTSETLADAYAESWALTAYLFNREKAGMKKYLTQLSERRLLQMLTPAQRIEEFQAAFGKTPDEIEPELVSWIRALRLPR